MDSDAHAAETRTVEINIKLPGTLEFDEMAAIEDEISEAAGEILKSHGLDRDEHKRIVEADYSK
jgi:hypothetical protein